MLRDRQAFDLICGSAMNFARNRRCAGTLSHGFPSRWRAARVIAAARVAAAP